jgi:hypothetical protein
MSSKNYRLEFIDQIKKLSNCDSFETACSKWQFKELIHKSGVCICGHEIE